MAHLLFDVIGGAAGGLECDRTALVISVADILQRVIGFLRLFRRTSRFFRLSGLLCLTFQLFSRLCRAQVSLLLSHPVPLWLYHV